jgi:hypothetical protein
MSAVRVSGTVHTPAVLRRVKSGRPLVMLPPPHTTKSALFATTMSICEGYVVIGPYVVT